MESDCIEVAMLIRIAKNVLRDSRSFPVDAIDAARKGCSIQEKKVSSPKIKKILGGYEICLSLKLADAVPKRKKAGECLEELVQKGLTIGSKVCCKDCLPFAKKGCLTKVTGFDHRPFVTINCLKINSGQEEVNVDSRSLRMIVSKKKK